MADLLMLPNQQLGRRIISLSLRANELSNAIQLSKEHMEKVRGDKARSIRLEKQAGQTRLKEQKTHYESIVARHQGFIEQVLDCYIFSKTTATTTRTTAKIKFSLHYILCLLCC